MLDPERPAEDVRVCLMWLAQLVIAGVVYFVVIMAIGNALEGHPYSPDVHHPAARFGMPPISFVGGYFFGILVLHYFAAFRPTGRWIWTPITALFVSLFLGTLHGGIAAGLVSAFDVEGKDDVAVWILSLPMLFYLGYSLACWIPPRRSSA
jgi:hypothetical protein